MGIAVAEQLLESRLLIEKGPSLAVLDLSHLKGCHRAEDLCDSPIALRSMRNFSDHSKFIVRTKVTRRPKAVCWPLRAGPVDARESTFRDCGKVVPPIHSHSGCPAQQPTYYDRQYNYLRSLCTRTLCFMFMPQF